MTEITYVPPVDYTSRDYASLLSDMLAQIPSVMPEWTSRNAGDPGIALLELFAYVGDNLNFYLDKVASEAFVGTAVQRESLLAMAQMLGYRPTGITPATAVLRFTNTVASPATVPAGTVVATTTGLGTLDKIIRFETDAELIVPASGTATVTATQGTTFSETVTSSANGQASQTYDLFNANVVQDSLSLTVNETGVPVQWIQVTNLIDYAGTDPVFEVREDASGVTAIVFGDGLAGRIPATGATVSATYRTADGAVGNVGAGSLDAILSVVPGGLTARNDASASGGADPESNDRLRINMTASLRTLSRAVTLSDYGILANEVGGVAKAAALAAVYTNVLLYIAPQGGGQPSAALVDEVEAYLGERSPVGTTVTVAGPSYVSIDVSANVAVGSIYRQNTVDLAVKRALDDLFRFDNVEFGDLITLGDVVATIQSVEGVRSCDVTLLARNPATGVQNIQCLSNEIPKQGTVTLTLSGGIP